MTKFKYILLSIVFLTILFGLYVWRVEPRWVQWNKIDMLIQNLPEVLENKKLIQISDIHIGKTVNEGFIINQFKKANNLKPDIVVYTGDFISPININQAPFEQLEKILHHAARGRLATIAILGNHDYGILARNGPRADSLVQILKNHKIRVLRNENINVLGLNIIGIDDIWGTNFHPQKAMKNLNPLIANLVLVHNPDVCDLNIWNGYTGWILSGHTHGGQVRFPFQKAKRLPVNNKNFDEGLKKNADGRILYINKGLGHSIPIRFNVRPEIAIFTLKKKG